MKWNTELDRLTEVLADLYEDEPSARTLAQSARLDLKRISFSTRSLDTWVSILAEALKESAIDNVIDTAVADYPNYQELLKARDDYHALVLSGSSTRKAPSQCDPKAFFSGGLATEGDIAENFDVLRTQYISELKGERGKGKAESKASWRELLFTQASKESSKKNIRVVIVYGHRGSGKTTLCKRMIHDLKEKSIPVLDLMSV